VSAANNQADPVISRLGFQSRSSGRVKLLPGFDKSRHTLPDAVNAATTGFLAKICLKDLEAETESLFQRARAAFDYKRREISLSLTSPTAELTTIDFVLEFAYALDEAAPSDWVLTRALHPKCSEDFLKRPECDALFAATFSSLVFTLEKGANVEAVIDAIEAAPAARGLKVAYPSGCEHCDITAEDVDAAIHFAGTTLEMVFPRNGSPRELLEGFLALRHRFRLADETMLGVLLE
jgi:hypothetical protein